MNSPVAYFAQGWQRVVDDLNEAGRRWVISPWITAAGTPFPWRRDDRLIIRGKAKDFVKGSSSLASIQDAIAQGVEVRRRHDLHAKVYAIEQNGGGKAWLGSANFTKPGFGGKSNNIEAMAGPFAFQGELALNVGELWKRASPVTLSILEAEIANVQLRQQDLLDTVRTNVLVLRVAFKYGQGHCGLRPEWLGINAAEVPWNTVTFPSVDYFPASSELVKSWRNLRDREMRALLRLGLVRVEGNLGDGFYVLNFSDRARIQAVLETTRSRLRNRVEKDVKRDLVGLRQNFSDRFAEVFERFKTQQLDSGVRKDLIRIDGKKVFASALTLFDAYAGSEPADLGYSFFIPFHEEANNTSGISSAAENLLRQPGLNLSN